MTEIAALFEKMRFKKKLFGGVDEMSVWSQLKEVQKEYETRLRLQEERSSALIQERDNEIARLKRCLAKKKTTRREHVE